MKYKNANSTYSSVKCLDNISMNAHTVFQFIDNPYLFLYNWDSAKIIWRELIE